jgi:hypothetical protein
MNFAAAFSSSASGLCSSQPMYWNNHLFILSSRSLVHALATALRKIMMEEEILVIPLKSLRVQVSPPGRISHLLETHSTPVLDPLLPPDPRLP